MSENEFQQFRDMDECKWLCEGIELKYEQNEPQRMSVNMTFNEKFGQKRVARMALNATKYVAIQVLRRDRIEC